MGNLTTITNKNATATNILFDGTLYPITGSGSIQLEENVMIRLLSDPRNGPRFNPTGDLTYSGVTTGAANVDLPTFSTGVIDLTVSPQTVTLAPALPGRSWVTRRLRITTQPGATASTSAVVTVQAQGGTTVDGWDISATTPTVLNLGGWAAPVNTAVTLAVGTAATGGALAVIVEIWGSYV